MKLLYITKSEFDFIKDNFVEWINNKIQKDPDTIFQFSADLTPEERQFIYKNSDNFTIGKTKVIEFDNFERVDNESKNEEDPEVKYEIVMRAGRKYYNKLQRYPVNNMGIINVINNKIDIQSKLITTILCMNSIILFYVLNK